VVAPRCRNTTLQQRGRLDGHRATDPTSRRTTAPILLLSCSARRKPDHSSVGARIVSPRSLRATTMARTTSFINRCHCRIRLREFAREKGSVRRSWPCRRGALRASPSHARGPTGALDPATDPLFLNYTSDRPGRRHAAPQVRRKSIIPTRSDQQSPVAAPSLTF